MSNYEKFSNIGESLLQSALLFNKIVDGKSIEHLSIDELRNKIQNQYLIAEEEIKETEYAFDADDIVEIYDGYCDTLYTFPLLALMFHDYKLQTKPNENNFYKEYKEKIDNLTNRFSEIFELVNQIDLDILSEYADRVIANNMEKFTTDEEVFKTWKSEYIQTSKVVDGVTYYFFVDENLKVKKRNGFPKVEVGDLFNGVK